MGRLGPGCAAAPGSASAPWLGAFCSLVSWLAAGRGGAGGGQSEEPPGPFALDACVLGGVGGGGGGVSAAVLVAPSVLCVTHLQTYSSVKPRGAEDA